MCWDIDNTDIGACNFTPFTSTLGGAVSSVGRAAATTISASGTSTSTSGPKIREETKQIIKHKITPIPTKNLVHFITNNFIQMEQTKLPRDTICPVAKCTDSSKTCTNYAVYHAYNTIYIT